MSASAISIDTTLSRLRWNVSLSRSSLEVSSISVRTQVGTRNSPQAMAIASWPSIRMMRRFDTSTVERGPLGYRSSHCEWISCGRQAATASVWLTRDAPTRLRSDTVLALAVLHHMAGRQGITFPAFANVINQFAAENAIVEFIPSTDEHIRSWPVARQAWYSLDGLIGAMRPYFPRVEVVESSPYPRQLALFRRGASRRTRGTGHELVCRGWGNGW